VDLPEPMLPSPGRLPQAAGWRFEMKWDGIRVLADVAAGRWRLLTRHGTDATSQFPELAEITDIVEDALVDGELVVLADGVHPDFSAAVGRLRARRARVPGLARTAPATVMAFDLLRLDGTDVRRRPYTERRRLLEGLGLRTDRWLVPPAFDDGPATVAASLEHGLEGVVAKRASSPYSSGRTRSWVKVRHAQAVDALVVGWREREEGGVSLLFAEATETGLALAGRCAAPASVLELLEPLATAEPVVAAPGQPRGTHWVRPELAIEVTAASRRPDGRLRDPRLVRIRPDRLG
jgi:bifunctional non-homologous end joining protein LigD